MFVIFRICMDRFYGPMGLCCGHITGDRTKYMMFGFSLNMGYTRKMAIVIPNLKIRHQILGCSIEPILTCPFYIHILCFLETVDDWSFLTETYRNRTRNNAFFSWITLTGSVGESTV